MQHSHAKSHFNPPWVPARSARRCRGPVCPLCHIPCPSSPARRRPRLPGRKRLSQQPAPGDSAGSSPLPPAWQTSLLASRSLQYHPPGLNPLPCCSWPRHGCAGGCEGRAGWEAWVGRAQCGLAHGPTAATAPWGKQQGHRDGFVAASASTWLPTGPGAHPAHPPWCPL